MAGTQVSVDIPVRLQVMQDSVNNLKKVLESLEPNSSGFNKLNKTIIEMTRYMEQFQIQTSKSFNSQAQFNKAEKTLDKMEESLARAKLQIEGLKFSDLKLDDKQKENIKEFEEQLKTARQELEAFKNQIKDSIINDPLNKEGFKLIDANAASKSFDQVEKIVSQKLAQINQQVTNSKQALEDYSKTPAVLAKNLVNNGFSKSSFLAYDDFFGTSKNGDRYFKTAYGATKEGLANALADQFKLDDAQRTNLIEALKKETVNVIEKAFSGEELTKGIKNPFLAIANSVTDKSVEKKLLELNTDVKNKQQQQQLLERMQGQFKDAHKDGGALAPGEEKFDETTQSIERMRTAAMQTYLDMVRGSNEVKDSTRSISTELQSFQDQLERSSVQFLQLQRSQQTFNSIKMAITNFMGFNQVLNLTKRAVQEAANHIKQLDTVMNGIAIVTDMTTADLWNQVDAYSQMAQRYGTTIQGAYEVSKIYYQAGYETNDVLTLMNETLKMSKISGLDYATTTDYMMNAIKGFKMEVADAASVVDVYSALAANTAVSQQELAEAMSKTASSMAGVGSTFEDTSAMIATMVAVTRESANNIGSAMKSIASRYGELTKDPAKLLDSEGEAMSFNKVDAALKSVGITLQTTDHQFRDFTDVILELSDVWDTLDSAQQRYYVYARYRYNTH